MNGRSPEADPHCCVVGTIRTRTFRSLRRSVEHRGPGVCCAAFPHAAHYRMETIGPPKFLGDPYVRALFSDPGGTFAPGPYGAPVRPSAFSTASAPAFTVLSRLNGTAHTSAVYASQGGSLHHHARLASGCGQLCRTGCFLLQGSNERFQQSIASSFPKLFLAQAKRTHLKPMPEKRKPESDFVRVRYPRFRPRSRPRPRLQYAHETNQGNPLLPERRRGGRDELVGGDGRRVVAWGVPGASRGRRWPGGPEDRVSVRYQGDRPGAPHRRRARSARRSRRREFAFASLARHVSTGGGAKSSTRGATDTRTSCLAAHTLGNRQGRIGHDASDPVI